MSYENFNLNQLRDECRARGLKVSGTKAELIYRLYENDINIQNSDNSNSKSDGTNLFIPGIIFFCSIFYLITATDILRKIKDEFENFNL